MSCDSLNKSTQWQHNITLTNALPPSFLSFKTGSKLGSLLEGNEDDALSRKGNTCTSAAPPLCRSGRVSMPTRLPCSSNTGPPSIPSSQHYIPKIRFSEPYLTICGHVITKKFKKYINNDSEENKKKLTRKAPDIRH